MQRDRQWNYSKRARADFGSVYRKSHYVNGKEAARHDLKSNVNIRQRLIRGNTDPTVKPRSEKVTRAANQCHTVLKDRETCAAFDRLTN